jgi:hypothetical protein
LPQKCRNNKHHLLKTAIFQNPNLKELRT